MPSRCPARATHPTALIASAQHRDFVNQPPRANTGSILGAAFPVHPIYVCFSSQYIIKTVEVESAKAKQALCESQSRNQYLQEQVGMQRQVLKEMEQQLQSSQKTAAQLRAQV